MLVFHFANGLWTAAITWGHHDHHRGAAGVMVPAPRSCSPAGSVIGFAMLSPAKAEVEDAMRLESCRAVDRTPTQSTPESETTGRSHELNL